MIVQQNEVETKYSIDGFRSLIDFEIGLTRGLNVLVGPNGSGKTNFIEFLDFLSILLLRGVSSAVSEIGGIPRVFSQERSTRKNSKVYVSVSGIAEIEEQEDKNSILNIFNFDYQLEVSFSKSLAAVFISREDILFYKLRSTSETQLARSAVGHVSVSRKPDSINENILFDVGPRLQVVAKRNPLSVKSVYDRIYDRISKKDKRISFETVFVSPDESILSQRQRYPAIDAVRTSIMRGRSFNLIPNRVRMPDDLTRSPVISQDGSGLTSIIYHLERAAQPNAPYKRTLRSRRFPPDTLESITDWARLVFPELHKISVSPDLHTGKYIGYLYVGEGNLKIPLQSASDGTLKWLCLVTLIITRGGTYSIEEPENFLHPKMQQYLIELIRDFSADPDKPGYFIISTHSETIINQCKPSEIILFRFQDGKTSCSRLQNQSSVLNEINNTGFGLGHYYANNAVS